MRQPEWVCWNEIVTSRPSVSSCATVKGWHQWQRRRGLGGSRYPRAFASLHEPWQSAAPASESLPEGIFPVNCGSPVLAPYLMRSRGSWEDLSAVTSAPLRRPTKFYNPPSLQIRVSIWQRQGGDCKAYGNRQSQVLRSYIQESML